MRAPRVRRWMAAAATYGIIGVATAVFAQLVWAQDLTFSAKVDQTTVEIGDPIHLVLTISGEIAGVQLTSPEFPEGFVVGGRSQSTSFSLRAGKTERSTSLVYVLIPHHAGTFQLGPFMLEHRHEEFHTEPIEILVEKPALPPPHLRPQGERFTL